MTLEKSVDRDTVRVGEWATYTLSATVADHPAKDVVITDKSLPEGMPVDLRGVTLEVNGVDVDDFQLDVEGNGFAAHLGDLGPGTSRASPTGLRCATRRFSAPPS